VALRHAVVGDGASEELVFESGELRVELARREVFRAGEEVHLTPTEYKLLVTLIRHAGRVLTHRQLLSGVWGPNYIDQRYYLRVYITQLRHKLERDPTRPRPLTTETGVGYRLREVAPLAQGS
jgi:two-component system KDP operon response regulator KdpE